MLELIVNGRAMALAEHWREERLLDALRDGLGLVGAKLGCGAGQCGACTVLLDGRAVKACNLLALQADGAAVQTVEGLQPAEGQWHPLQRAFSRHHGLQCGFCTPGMLMRACAMAAEDCPAEPGAVRAALAGNLCRCTGYEGIVNAVCDGLAEMRRAGL